MYITMVYAIIMLCLAEMDTYFIQDVQTKQEELGLPVGFYYTYSNQNLRHSVSS